MNTIPAQEIKRRGIAAVDDLIADGPVYIIRNNRPQYVVLTEARYRELLEAQEEAYEARLRASLEDLKAGRVTRGTAEDLIKLLDLEE
ncbi:MAG: prevent-host-death protein [Anaerolineae bacterium]